MNFAKIITVAMITVLSAGAFASETTKCSNQSQAGMFANTNPKPSVKQASGTTGTQAGTR